MTTRNLFEKICLKVENCVTLKISRMVKYGWTSTIDKGRKETKNDFKYFLENILEGRSMIFPYQILRKDLIFH